VPEQTLVSKDDPKKGIPVMVKPNKDQKVIPPVPKKTRVSKNDPKKDMPVIVKKQDKIQNVSIEEEKGRLIINTTPWANIYINGKSYGTTPISIEKLKAGKYTVRLENPNFPAWETEASILKDKSTKISHKFGGFGKLIVNSTPWGEVYLDGTLMGHTPLTINNITARNHEIRVSKPGYAVFTKTFNLKEGTTERISVNLEKVSN
jgi:hypothetical protein